MYTVSYIIFTLSQLALSVWAFRLYRKQPAARTLTLLLPIAALVYDNAIVAAGRFIGEGQLLKILSVPRFVGHAFLTPIWIVSALLIYRQINDGWLAKPGGRVFTWGLYAVMAALGLLESLILLELGPRQDGDLLSYTNLGGLPGPPVPAITMVLVVLVVGALLVRYKWPWLLLGALFMLVAAGIPPRIVGFIISNGGEVVLALAMVTTERWLQEKNYLI